MLQCAVVCGSVLQSEAVCEGLGLLYAVRCRVLQYVAVCCKCVASVLQVCCSVWQRVKDSVSYVQCVAVNCVCCSVLQCVAACEGLGFLRGKALFSINP